MVDYKITPIRLLELMNGGWVSVQHSPEYKTDVNPVYARHMQENWATEYAHKHYGTESDKAMPYSEFLDRRMKELDAYSAVLEAYAIIDDLIEEYTALSERADIKPKLAKVFADLAEKTRKQYYPELKRSSFWRNSDDLSAWIEIQVQVINKARRVLKAAASSEVSK